MKHYSFREYCKEHLKGNALTTLNSCLAELKTESQRRKLVNRFVEIPVNEVSERLV